MHFSVLMSIYKNDKENEVINAIDSILNQRIKPNQIVIVIDGPISDVLNEIIIDYSKKHSYIDIVRLKVNVGLGKALNYGLDYCKYEYVARMDSDDLSLPDRFEKQIDYLTTHPEVDVLGGQIAEYDSTMSHKIAIRNVPITNKEITEKMKSRNGMNHVSVMFKKSSVIASGSYQHCSYFEDYYLWCRMIVAGNIFHNLKDILVNVRTGEEMYQRRGGKAYNKSIIEFQKKIYKLGFINRFQFLRNICVRLSVANMPNIVRGYLYKTKLRTKDME